MAITYVSTAEEAQHFRELGYCPIECSFGDVSVVDALQMDHHGSWAHLEPVSLRAYRDYAGWRAADPRFVVTGAADADAAFAIAALGGLLPHPALCIESQGAGTNLTFRQQWSPDDPSFVRILELAQTVARADMDPFCERWEESKTGLLLLCYKQTMHGQPHNADAFRAGVECWRDLVETPPRQWLESVRAQERERVQRARTASMQVVHPQVAFVECPVWGWDVWYAEVAPVIVASQAETRRCSIGCRDGAIASRLFGPRGLLEVTHLLSPSGWGGRSTIVGSPRGVAITRDQALTAAKTVADLIKPSPLPHVSIAQT